MADVDVLRVVSKNANSYRQACPLAARTNWRRFRAGSANSYTRAQFAFLLTVFDLALAIERDSLEVRKRATSSRSLATLNSRLMRNGVTSAGIDLLIL